jgi:hypothetical protein
MKTEGTFLPSSPQLPTGPYSEPDESNPHLASPTVLKAALPTYLHFSSKWSSFSDHTVYVFLISELQH